MHSRIYQVSETPIKAEDLVHESRYYNSFVGSRADYVAEVEHKSTEYIADLKWLQEATKGIDVYVEAGTLVVKSKKAYFEKKHEMFQKVLEELQDITLEEFAEDKKSIGTGTQNYSLTFKIHDLNEAFNDKYSFYIDEDDFDGLTPLDNWVRHAEENKVYYIGTITDYHF